MDEEAVRLTALHEACERVLAHLEADDESEFAQSLRNVCHQVEEQLRMVGASKLLERASRAGAPAAAHR